MRNIFSLALVATSFYAVRAQMLSIANPAAGEAVSPGSNITVQLTSAEGLTGFQQVSVAFGIASSTPPDSSSPSSNTSTLGTVLYAGNFDPQRHELDMPAYQNFTVAVPSTLQAGPSQLNVAHFYLVGAGLEPVLEMKNMTMMVTG